MGYCLNPNCTKPQNPPNVKECQTCGTSLLLSDRYLIIKKLGKGGFGATFLAIDRSLPGNPCCVVKQLRPSNSDPGLLKMARELFEREAGTLGRIGNHPQVPRLLDYFESDQQFYLIQEFVQGLNLQQEVKQKGTFDEAKVKHFLEETLPILDYIHKNRVIHRDIKPANIIRREIDNKLVLIDFGAVKNEINTIAAANTSSQTALTAFAIGTLGFAPPEQLSMRPVYASDIYALGVTAIYLLTGKSPKNLGINPETGELNWQESVNISDSLTEILEKMLELSVRNRYKSGEEILAKLNYIEESADLSTNLISQSPPPLRNSWEDGVIDTGLLNVDRTSFDRTNVSNQKPPSSRRVSKQAAAIRNLHSRRQRPYDTDEEYTEVTASLAENDRDYPGSKKQKKQGTDNSAPTTNKITKLPDELTREVIIKAYQQGWLDFCQRSLKGLNLRKLNLSYSKFHESQLTNVNFQEAILIRADFGHSDLSGANFKDAKINSGYFAYANLENADLRGADLSDSNLKFANLKGANLCGANLTSVRVEDNQLALAKTNWRTIFPRHSRRNMS